MNSIIKGILLLVGAYLVTLVMAGFTIFFTIYTLESPQSCSDIGRALVTLWVVIAVEFLASLIMVAIVAWKIIEGAARRWVIVIVHGLLLIVNYIILAFGLMVALNC